MLNQFKTALFVGGLILFFFFGSLAVGLAHETVPGKFVYNVKVDLDGSNKIAHVAPQSLRVSLDWETCDVPTPSAKTLEAGRLFEAPPAIRAGVFAAYGGRDEFNVAAQVESFLYRANQLGIHVGVAYDPRGQHNLATGLRLLPEILRWASERVPSD